MKSLSIREIRTELTRLDEILSTEGEVLITRHGRAIARLLPIRKSEKPPSHADLRAKMKRLQQGSEVLIRQDRDRR